jgi:hypothetical protein
VKSDLLSWFLAVEREMSTPHPRSSDPRTPTDNNQHANRSVVATKASRMPGSEKAWPALGAILNSAVWPGLIQLVRGELLELRRRSAPE